MDAIGRARKVANQTSDYDKRSGAFADRPEDTINDFKKQRKRPSYPSYASYDWVHTGFIRDEGLEP